VKGLAASAGMHCQAAVLQACTAPGWGAVPATWGKVGGGTEQAHRAHSIRPRRVHQCAQPVCTASKPAACTAADPQRAQQQTSSVHSSRPTACTAADLVTECLRVRQPEPGAQLLQGWPGQQRSSTPPCARTPSPSPHPSRTLSSSSLSWDTVITTPHP